MCEQSEGSLIPLVAWRVRYLRSLQTAAVPENARRAQQSQSKKRKIDKKLAAKPGRPAGSGKRRGKTRAAGA
jgi:hypothetical protein